MGRRTHQSIRRTLPGRLNIVLSAQPGFQASPEAIVVRSFEEALRLPQVTSSDEVFIFGGDKLYREAMPRLMRLYLTRVHLSVEGDAFFEFNPAEWKLSSEERHPAEADQPAYDYLVYERT
jgi:dihydrofolate reductase